MPPNAFVEARSQDNCGSRTSIVITVSHRFDQIVAAVCQALAFLDERYRSIHV